MPDRLTSLDASFLYLEEATTAMHVGSVMVFQPPDDGFDYDRLVRLISARIAFVPRYRQRVRDVPGHLANPVWVDDEDFDVTYHVRRSALPRPGSDEQLQEFVARIQPRPLDRTRPLWEVYLVEGLDKGRFALVTKSHQALVDGINAVDIAHVIVDGDPDREVPVTDTWRPAKEPSDVELLTGGGGRRTTPERGHRERPGRGGRRPGGRRAGAGHGRHSLTTAARTAARPAPTSPLNVEIGEARRWAMVATSLEDYRKVRARHSRRGPRRGDGQRRRAGHGRRGPPRLAADPRRARLPATTVRAMVPVSVYDADDIGPRSAAGSRPSSSTCRSASRARPSGCTRSPSRCAADGGRPGGQCRHPGGHRRVRPADAALARRPAGQRRVTAALQPRDHQRARPPAPALRRRRPDALHYP